MTRVIIFFAELDAGIPLKEEEVQAAQTGVLLSEGDSKPRLCDCTAKLPEWLQLSLTAISLVWQARPAHQPQFLSHSKTFST